jgi:hypothetical protein
VSYQREHPDIVDIVGCTPVDFSSSVMLAVSRSNRKWLRIVSATGTVISGDLPAEPVASATPLSTPDGSAVILFADHTLRKYTVGATALTLVWAVTVGSAIWVAADTGWIAAPGWHPAHVLFLDPATGDTLQAGCAPTPVKAAVGLGASLFTCGDDQLAQITAATGATVGQLDLVGVRGPEGAYIDFGLMAPVFVGHDWIATVTPGTPSATYAGRFTDRQGQAPSAGTYRDRNPYVGPWWEG